MRLPSKKEAIAGNVLLETVKPVEPKRDIESCASVEVKMDGI